ncbi:MAG: glucose-6-phosphate dehydrogenase [Nanoarchaeota archaeon]
MGDAVGPGVFVLFGSTGDLAKRKLMPALYRMFRDGIIGEHNPVLCVGRRKFTTQAYLKFIEIDTFVKELDKRILAKMWKFITYVHLDFESDDMSALADAIRAADKKHVCGGNRVIYLAMASSLFADTLHRLKDAGLLESEGFVRVAFEKPFGDDLKSAQELNKVVSGYFTEDQIFRIDHYLGKDLVENMLVFRFANSIFEQIWNREFVDHVQITVSETIGVGSRAGYYEGTGAIKDMVQNHLMQILSLMAMAPPLAMEPEAIRDEKARLLKGLRMVKPEDLVVGQYASGLIDKKVVKGYVEEEGVVDGSQTETFVALRAFIDNHRWRGVPFYLRTGKRMSQTFAEIKLCLKDVSSDLFGWVLENQAPNVITIRISPDEGIIIRFNAKVPGPKMVLRNVKMSYCHHCLFGYNTPEAYELLMQQIFLGNQTLFTRWDMVEMSWKYIDPLVRMVRDKKVALIAYPAGSDGPKEAHDLLARDGRKWLAPDDPYGEE